MSDLPPNIREALETELAGVERRAAVADGDTRALLETRANLIRQQLGIPTPKPKRAATGKETRPVNGAEVR